MSNVVNRQASWTIEFYDLAVQNLESKALVKVIMMNVAPAAYVNEIMMPIPTSRYWYDNT